MGGTRAVLEVLDPSNNGQRGLPDFPAWNWCNRGLLERDNNKGCESRYYFQPILSRLPCRLTQCPTPGTDPAGSLHQQPPGMSDLGGVAAPPGRAQGGCGTLGWHWEFVRMVQPRWHWSGSIPASSYTGSVQPDTHWAPPAGPLCHPFLWRGLEMGWEPGPDTSQWTESPWGGEHRGCRDLPGCDAAAVNRD